MTTSAPFVSLRRIAALLSHSDSQGRCYHTSSPPFSHLDHEEHEGCLSSALVGGGLVPPLRLEEVHLCH